MSGAWAPGPSWSQPPAPSLLLLLWCLHQSKRESLVVGQSSSHALLVPLLP